jgi:hypothetical protein
LCPGVTTEAEYGMPRGVVKPYITRDYSAGFLLTPRPPGRDLSTPPPSIRGPEGPVDDPIVIPWWWW